MKKKAGIRTNNFRKMDMFKYLARSVLHQPEKNIEWILLAPRKKSKLKKAKN